MGLMAEPHCRVAVAQFQPRSTFFGPMPPTIAATQPVLGSTIVTPDCSCSVSPFVVRV